MRSVGILLTLALRSLSRNKGRSLITLAAISLGVMSAVVLSAFARGLSVGMAENAIKTLTGHIQIHSPGYLDDPTAELSFEKPSTELEQQLKEDGVVQIAHRIRVPAVATSERESVGVFIVGINPSEEVGISFISDALREGVALNNDDDNGIVVGRDLLRVLKTELGKRIVIITQDVNNKVIDRGFRIIGVFESELKSTEKGYIFMGRKTAQDWLGLDSKISETVLKVNSAKDAESSAIAIRQDAIGLDVKPWQDLEPLVTSLTRVHDGFLVIWFLIVIISIAFGVINAQLMSIFERTREFGVVMALGLKPRQLVLLVGLEAAVILIVGTIIGNLLGGLGYAYLNQGLDLSGFASASEHLGFTRIIYPHFSLADWVLCDGLLLGIGILGSLYPAWLASRLNPVAAISGREKE
jgi:ABC-type lipoprotein release transport system permease subunit